MNNSWIASKINLLAHKSMNKVLILIKKYQPNKHRILRLKLAKIKKI